MYGGFYYNREVIQQVICLVAFLHHKVISNREYIVPLTERSCETVIKLIYRGIAFSLSLSFSHEIIKERETRCFCLAVLSFSFYLQICSLPSPFDEVIARVYMQAARYHSTCISRRSSRSSYLVEPVVRSP